MAKIAWKNTYLVHVPHYRVRGDDLEVAYYSTWRGDCPKWFAEAQRNAGPDTRLEAVRTAKVAKRDFCPGCAHGGH